MTDILVAHWDEGCPACGRDLDAPGVTAADLITGCPRTNPNLALLHSGGTSARPGRTTARHLMGAQGAAQAPASTNNYTPGRPGRIDTLVWHTMVGSEASARARFQSPSGGASAHYGVCLDGRLVQYVGEGDTAWHAGNWPVNQRSIGVEHEDDGDYNGARTPELYERSAQLMADLLRRYPSVPRRRTANQGGGGVAKHHDVSQQGTACPDSLDVDRIFARAMQLLAPPQPIHPPEVHDMTPGSATFKGHNFVFDVGDDRGCWVASYGPGESYADAPFTRIGTETFRSGFTCSISPDGDLVVYGQADDGFLYRSYSTDGTTWSAWEKGKGHGATA